MHKLSICFSISQINWGLTKDIISIVGTLGGLCIAVYGLHTWKRAHSFEKKSEYIVELDIAINGLFDSAYLFRSAVWAFQKKEITTEEFTARITKHTIHKSTYKLYLRLLKHELSKENGEQLMNINSKFDTVFDRYLQLSTSTEDICMMSEERDVIRQGLELKAVTEEFIEFIYSLKK